MTIDHHDLPRLRTLGRHAIPHIVEGSLIPLALFYGALAVVGIWGALIAALAWSYTAIARRLLTGRRVPGLLLLGAMGMTARTIVAFSTGSVFIYFLQPTFTTVAVAGAFLVSAPSGKPLAQRLAADFYPLSPDVLARPAIRRVFVRITLLWAFVNLASAVVTIVLLVAGPIDTYPISKAIASAALLVAGVAVSTRWFKQALRHGEATA
jgi:hypothetical protein